MKIGKERQRKKRYILRIDTRKYFSSNEEYERFLKKQQKAR
jgi:hypothetical protein